MARSRIAALVVAGTLAVGGGIALAETDPDDPVTVDEDEVEGLEVEGLDDEGDDDGEEGDVDLLDDDDGAGVAGGHENHGAVVSEAAQNHDHDEDCGNHGAYVSHVARTGEEPDCATGGAGLAGTDSDDGAVEADDVESDDESDESEDDDHDEDDEDDDDEEHARGKGRGLARGHGG